MSQPRRGHIPPYLPVLASACMLLILSFGYRAGFGLFMEPMSEARGWGRDVLSLALAVQNLAWGLCAMVAGGFADRYGNLRVLLGGAALYGLGMWTMAFSVDEMQIVSSAGLLAGAGIAGTSFGIVLPAIARAVPAERRAWALGVGTAAGSFGQFAVVPLIQLLVEWLGWLMALQVMGASALLMALFALPLARYGGPAEPKADGDEDGGEAKTDNSGEAVPVKTLAKTEVGLWQIASQALQVRPYRLLTAGFFVCGFQLAFITVHMPVYVVDMGFPARVGAYSLSLIGLCNVVGAYYAGVFSGRLSMRKLLTNIYLARALSISLFMLMPVSAFNIYFFSVAIGFLWLATVPPTSGLVALFFGTRYMSFLYGIVFLSHQLGSFTGVWLGGWLYEATGNYDAMWLGAVVLSLLAAALHWPIREASYEKRLYAGA